MKSLMKATIPYVVFLKKYALHSKFFDNNICVICSVDITIRGVYKHT